MRSAPKVVFTPEGNAAITSIQVDDPAPDEILVSTRKTLVSAGSERNAYEMPRSGILSVGYSAVGVVEEVGQSVGNYAPGDHVLIISPHQGADLVDVSSPSNWGGYAGRIPDDVTDAQATFGVLGDVALHGVRRAKPYLGESVAVFAQGLVGQLTTYFAARAGAYPVIAIDLLDERLEHSRRSGATHTVNAAREDAVQAVHDLTGGGARTVFMVARNPAVFADCLKAAARGGTVCLSGSPPGTVEIELQPEVLRHELDILGNYSLDYPAEPYHRFLWTRPANRDYVFDLIGRGELNVDSLVTHDVPYTRAPEMYEMIASGPEGWLGVLFDWTDQS
ncbi:MAG: zinc-binding alcohol dehydrogenase [Chloroflexi bacterium]|nr:zinc-binding alcohol dehydrogenase [Chloroflexota bacterium]